MVRQCPRVMLSAPAFLATWAELVLDVLLAGCVGPHGQGVEGTLNWRGCTLRGLCTLVLMAAFPTVSHRYPLGCHCGLKSMSGLSLGTLSLSCHLLDASESCWLENKAENHNPESWPVLKEARDWWFYLRTQLLAFSASIWAWREKNPACFQCEISWFSSCGMWTLLRTCFRVSAWAFHFCMGCFLHPPLVAMTPSCSPW